MLNDGVFLQIFQRDKLDRGHVRCFQNYRRSAARFQCFFPPRNAQTPSVARHQPRKLIFWNWCDQIIASCHSKLKKLLGNLNAYNVQTIVGWPRPAVTISKEARHGVTAAGNQICAKYVLRKFHGDSFQVASFRHLKHQ